VHCQGRLRFDLLDGFSIGFQAGFTDPIDTHFYVFDNAQKCALHGFGVHLKTLRREGILNPAGA
jgi:hypothetical protein